MTYTSTIIYWKWDGFYSLRDFLTFYHRFSYFLPTGRMFGPGSRSVCQQRQVLEYSHLNCEALFLRLEAYLPQVFLKGYVPWNLNQGHFWMESYLFLKTTCLKIVRSPWGRCSMYRKNADNISGWSDFTLYTKNASSIWKFKKTKKKSRHWNWNILNQIFFVSEVWGTLFWGSLILFRRNTPSMLVRNAADPRYGHPSMVP